MKPIFHCLFGLVVLMAAGRSGMALESVKEPLNQVKENVDKKIAVLVDVREKDEWDGGHVEGAIFLPLSLFKDGLSADELKPIPKDKIVYIHCVSGFRAQDAADDLGKLGYKVRPLDSSYEKLVEAGFLKANK